LCKATVITKIQGRQCTNGYKYTTIVVEGLEFLYPQAGVVLTSGDDVVIVVVVVVVVVDDNVLLFQSYLEKYGYLVQLEKDSKGRVAHSEETRKYAIM